MSPASIGYLSEHKTQGGGYRFSKSSVKLKSTASLKIVKWCVEVKACFAST
jgi:hypothetical protein